MRKYKIEPISSGIREDLLKKIDGKTKATVTRLDWNAADYTERFPGTDVLKLNFEIHAGHGHDH